MAAESVGLTTAAERSFYPNGFHKLNAWNKQIRSVGQFRTISRTVKRRVLDNVKNSREPHDCNLNTNDECCTRLDSHGPHSRILRQAETLLEGSFKFRFAGCLMRVARVASSPYQLHIAPRGGEKGPRILLEEPGMRQRLSRPSFTNLPWHLRELPGSTSTSGHNLIKDA